MPISSQSPMSTTRVWARSRPSITAASSRIDSRWRCARWDGPLERLDPRGRPSPRRAFDAFCLEQADWLDEYALFMAVKDAHDLVAWTHWDPAIAHRDPAALARWRQQCARERRAHQFAQYLFFSQWRALRDHCHAQGVSLMGDVPIFVAHDSADVWARRDLFKLA